MTRCEGYTDYSLEDLGETKLIQFLFYLKACFRIHTLAGRLLIVSSRNLLGFVQF
jgi:hypothetical protein